MALATGISMTQTGIAIIHKGVDESGHHDDV